jgi:membrane protein YqaA with SNARE-associated domain
MNKVNQWWLRYEYKHSTLAAIAVVVFIALLDSTVVLSFLGLVEDLGYFGAFIAGLLSVSFFTAVPAIVLLVDLANELDPVALAIVAGAGSMIGDWLLLQFFEEKVIHELKPLFHRLHLRRVVEFLRKKYTSWILLGIGSLVRATPIPDEIGLALLGISHFPKKYLLVICFILNTLGMLVLVMTAKAISS